MTPPKVKYDRDTILRAALEIVREEGLSAVRARAIASRLHCSTKPVFIAFSNMEDLMAGLFEMINGFFGEYLVRRRRACGADNEFLGTGLAYIDFARNEKNLFKALFLSETIDISDLSDLVNPAEHAFILDEIPSAPPRQDSMAVDPEKQQALFLNIWLYTHGLAVMIAANDLKISDNEIAQNLKDIFHALSQYYRREENSK